MKEENKTNNICPICGHELKEGEVLVAKYHAPKNWWVLYHNKNNDIQVPTTIGNNSYCGKAGFQIVKENE
jgi:hypothetical protein